MTKYSLFWKYTTLLGFFLLLFSSQSFSAIHQITNNGAWNREVSLYNGTIAWHSDVDGDWEIFYWDGNEIIQITNNDANDTDPSLYNGSIAWQSDIDGDSEIFYWDGTTVNQITNNDSFDANPSLYDGTIAWTGEGENNQAFEIFYWDGNVTISIAQNNRYVIKPSLYDGKIAYNGNVSNLLDGVYYWNGVETVRITEEWESGYYETLYNGTIAWHDPYFIHFWDGNTIHHITSGGDTTEPSLHNGAIAWESGGLGNLGIEYWDGNIIHRISTNLDRYPSTYDGTIAWERHYIGEERSEIFYWDGNNQPIANAGNDQSVKHGAEALLDGSGSFDPDGTIVKWDWLIEYQGNPSLNKTSTGETTIVTGLKTGTYSTTLTVTDNYGDIATDTMLIEVSSFPWILFHPKVKINQ